MTHPEFWLRCRRAHSCRTTYALHAAGNALALLFFAAGAGRRTWRRREHCMAWHRPAILVGFLLAGCAEPQSGFMARLAGDCAAGDQAACHLMRAPPGASAFSSLADTQSRSRKLVEEDLEAMIRGMAQAHEAGRLRGDDSR